MGPHAMTRVLGFFAVRAEYTPKEPPLHRSPRPAEPVDARLLGSSVSSPGRKVQGWRRLDLHCHFVFEDQWEDPIGTAQGN
jgi:hypothetical protein